MIGAAAAKMAARLVSKAMDQVAGAEQSLYSASREVLDDKDLHDALVRMGDMLEDAWSEMDNFCDLMSSIEKVMPK